ncbi:hypothetical protein ACIBI4_14340 [Streptomyces sp. NPDC050418]|uniref:hypothetical protein n=1 Tax=Streptomyces sp. NPDC050418 TaxID=3365612 RepID=UPI0037A2696B
MRVRNVLGSLLALAGAAAVVWSPFRAWYDGRLGRDYRLGELFSADGVTDAEAGLFASLFLPFLFVALVTLVGVVLRSRLLLAFAGIVAMGFSVLWMVRVGQAEGSLSVDSEGNGLDVGAGSAFVGGRRDDPARGPGPVGPRQAPGPRPRGSPARPHGADAGRARPGSVQQPVPARPGSARG